MKFVIDKDVPEILHIYDKDELISSGHVGYYAAATDEMRKLRNQVALLREALEYISSPTQTRNLLWWQKKAREALEQEYRKND